MPSMPHPPELHVVDRDHTAASDDATDDDLMLLVRAGHQAAFEILVRRHQDLVIGLATRYVGDASVGRDVAQDVFLALWAERERYELRGRFRSYLVSCTIHRCQVVVRQARCHELKNGVLATAGQVQTEAPIDDEALRALVEAEDRREVRRKLTLLPEKMRAVLILRFTQDLPIQEIASVTGLREGTVKSHLFRGLARLHRLIGKDRT
jgi:RNA polymerase sigma factor (sigma-70 family)